MPNVDTDIIQFSSAVYYCSEAEGKVDVDIIRLGEEDNQCSVRFETVDISAQAGVKYVAKSGELLFSSGEFFKSVRVDLISNNAFEATLEFGLQLAEPKNAILGTRTCRILIADDDAFPTNKYHHLLAQGRIEEVSGSALMIEYFRMAFSDRPLRRAAFWNGLTDQYTNFTFVWQVIMNRILIDSVLTSPPIDAFYTGMLPTTRSGKATVVVVFMLVPHLMITLLYRLKAQRRIMGMATNQLQENLLRKYLNYNEPSRAAVSVADLTMAITRDVPELIQEGFMSLFDMTESLGLVLILGGLAFAQATSSSEIPLIIILFILMPLLMLIFIRVRHAKTERLELHLFYCQTEVLSLIQQITGNFRLITDYWQQPTMVKAFGGKIQATNKAAMAALIRKIENGEFAPFVTTLAVSVYVLANFDAVAEGQLPLGIFISTVAAWRGIGGAYQRAYLDMLKIQHALAPLRNIAYYMNLPVDTQDRMDQSRWCLETFTESSALAQEQLFRGQPSSSAVLEQGTMVKRGKVLEKASYPQDLFRIAARDITFSYPSRTGGGFSILHEASFHIPQGALVVMSGSRGSGKKTVLELIAGVLLTSKHHGQMFVPPHLRVLHVAKEPQSIPELDIFSNIIFGSEDPDDHKVSRVLKICQRLGLKPEVLHMVENASKDHQASHHASGGALKAKATGSAASVVLRQATAKAVRGMHSFPFTEQCLLNLCRAFVMNPEVLILHKPLENFNLINARRVLDLLREFVDMRGLEMPKEKLHLRRPRTVIMSVDGSEALEVADMMFSVLDGSVNHVDLTALSEVHKSVTKFFYKIDADGDGLLGRKDFLRTITICPEYLGLFGVPHGSTSAEATRILQEVYTIIDDGNNGELDVEEMCEYLISAFKRDTKKLAEALRHPETVELTVPKRSQDPWAGTDIPPDAPMPLQSVSPPARRPG